MSYNMCGCKGDMIKGLLEKIAKEGEMKAFRHCNFWWPMDTMRDKNTLEWMWDNGHAPWKVLK